MCDGRRPAPPMHITLGRVLGPGVKHLKLSAANVCSLQSAVAEQNYPPPMSQSALDEGEKRPGTMLQCLVDAIGDTHVSCAEETVRAVHGALQFYHLVRPAAMCRV